MGHKALTPEGSSYLRIPAASVYTGISESRLRKLTSPKIAAIPVYKDGHSTLISKTDLDAYMQSKRRYCRQEIEQRATTYVATH